MRTTVILITGALAFTACKKDEPDTRVAPGPSQPSAISAYSKLAVGNYWVYSIVQYDAQGNETPTVYTDSVAVVGDSVLNGNTYYVVQGTRPLHSPGNAQNYTSIQRDSADCIVGLHGSIIFRLSDLGNVLYQAEVPPDGTLTWSTEPDQVQHSVPAGTFTCYDTRGVLDLPGYPQRTIHKLRGSGVGLVEESTVYVVPGSGFKKKLVSYHVE